MRDNFRQSASHEDGYEPATRADVDSAVDELAQINRKQIDRIDARLDNVELRLERVERGQSAILDVVKTIDSKLKPLLDLPDRIEHVEHTAFRSGLAFRWPSHMMDGKRSKPDTAAD